MALHLTLKFGDSFEIMNGDKVLRVYVNKRQNNVQVSLEGPRCFEISRVIKGDSVQLGENVRKKIADENQ